MKIALAALIALSAATPALADSQAGWSEERTCFKTEYREEYVPGTENNPGYVKSWKDTIEVPCAEYPYEHREEYPDIGRRRVTPAPMPRYRRHTTVYEDVDTNDCSDGRVVGCLLGGGLAGFGSRGKDRWWAIPSGIIGGAMVGCAMDGG